MWVIVVCMHKDGCLFLAHIAVGCMMLSAVEAPILEKNALQVHLHSGAKGNFKKGYW